MTRRNLLRLIALALAGLAWRAPIWWFGPLAALILPLWGPLTENKRDRFRSAAIYFASGSVGLVPAAGVFFGHGTTSYLLGAVLWAGSSALLALPWVWADARRPWTIIAALGLDAIPPIGLFGWLSPLTAAGIFWPGGGIIGLVFFCLGIIAFHTANNYWEIPKIRRLARLAVVILFVPIFHSDGTAAANYFSGNSKPKFGTVISSLGQMPKNIMSVISRNEKLIAQAMAVKSTVVVLPETVVGWRTGSAHQLENAVPPGRTWLIGATTLGRDHRLRDSIVAVRHDRPGRILFRAAFPVPVSMWHPWKPGGYGATWSEPVRTIDGRRVAAVICYDQLLVWPWLEAAWGDPQVILAVQNEWWARGTGIPVIQRNSSIAWSRLIDARLVLATNW